MELEKSPLDFFLIVLPQQGTQTLLGLVPNTTQSRELNSEEQHNRASEQCDLQRQ